MESAIPWLEVSLEASPDLEEPLSAFLFELGATGLVLEEGGQPGRVKASFPPGTSLAELEDRLRAFALEMEDLFPEAPRVRFHSQEAIFQDWAQEWRRFFQPIQATPNLLILPEWVPEPPSVNGHILRMDPGPAFGTGSHATTRMCLQAMEGLPLKGQRLLDVGTGSGILAMYGAMLGAGQIMALDVDPDALEWAGHNIRLNGLADRIHLSSQPVEQIQTSFFLICANLILKEILRLLPIFKDRTEAGGWCILSGILMDQMSPLKTAVQEAGLDLKQVLTENEWITVVVQNS